MLVVRRVEREGGGISKPLHLYLCFVFSFEECWEKKESGGILKPFPVSRVPVTIEVRIKINCPCIILGAVWVELDHYIGGLFKVKDRQTICG